MSSSNPPPRFQPWGSKWSGLMRWLGRATLEELRAYDEQWWLRMVVPETDADGFPTPFWGAGYMDELVELHRLELAMLFAEAAELRIAKRPGTACLLGPRLDPWRERRWRRRARGRLHRALGSGLEVPLGLLVCWVWPCDRWMDAELLALASLKLETTSIGRLIYARSRLATPGAGRPAGVADEVEGLLARTRLERGSRAASWRAATSGSLHELRGDLPLALNAYLRAARDDGSLGAWARGVGLALALLLEDRRASVALHRVRRRAATPVVRHAEAESVADVEQRLPHWIDVRRRRPSGIAEELFEWIAGEDDLGAGVAFEVAARM